MKTNILMNEKSVKSKTTKDVSVIIVNWNTKELLVACINSIKNETHNATLEIIVVDNASTDGSQEALKQRFPDVTLIQNKENFGFAKANNIGIQASRGKYICLVNSDVQVKSVCIDRMINYMEHHPEIGMLGPKIFLPGGDVQLSCQRFPSLWRQFCSAICLHWIFPQSKIFTGTENRSFSYDKISKVDVLIGAFWLLRRKALDQVGLLDETFFFYGEDKDWCKRFWAKKWEVIFFPDAEIIHFTGGSSTDTPAKYYIQLHRANLQYWEKHYSNSVLKCAKTIMMLHQIVRIVLRSGLYAIKSSDRTNNSYKINRSLTCLQWLLTTSSKTRFKGEK